MVNHSKQCDNSVNALVLKYNHDQLKWSQDVLLFSLDLLGYDTEISGVDLEVNKVDAVITQFDNKINVEHKFVGLLTKRKNSLIKVIEKTAKQRIKKNLGLLIITTLTNKQQDIDQLLFKFTLCLHIVLIDDKTMASVNSKKISSDVISKIDSQIDDNEEFITPLNARMLLMLEAIERRGEDRAAELKANDEQLKANDEQLKANDEQLKLELTKLKNQITEMKKSNEQIKGMIKQLLETSKR